MSANPTYSNSLKRPKQASNNEDRLRQALELILDAVDYTNDACECTEMVGAVLSTQIIQQARIILKETKVYGK